MAHAEHHIDHTHAAADEVARARQGWQKFAWLVKWHVIGLLVLLAVLAAIFV